MVNFENINLRLDMQFFNPPFSTKHYSDNKIIFLHVVIIRVSIGLSRIITCNKMLNRENNFAV